MSKPRAAAISVLSGIAAMSLELTAVRLLAPYFGDSAYVWTNVIGVMLAALAVGAWLGGRLAHPERGARRVARLLLVAGLLVTVIPLCSGVLGGFLLPSDLPLDAAMGALVRGSLVATLLLFAPAVLLIGCVSPMLVTLLVARRVAVGPAAGLVGAAATMGSLLGTFVTTHLAVPEFGSRVTVWGCAALLLLAAALARPGVVRAAVVGLPILLMPWHWAPLREVDGGVELLAERESAYQYLQVVADDRAPQGRTTELKINEGLDSFHSIAIEGTAFTGGRYYDFHAAVPFLVGNGRRPASLRVLSLGAAAGTFARLFAAAHPGCTVDGVEIDPEVVALGDQFFGGRPAGAIYAGLDARVFANRATGQYEVILVDAYERQIYIPAHVASREFFTEVKRLLRPGGAVSINTGGRRFDDPVVVALARTVATVFGEAWAFRVPRSRNFMVVARRDAVVDPAVLDPDAVAEGPLRSVLADCAATAAWRRFAPGEPVLVDDRPFLDLLQDRALERDLGTAEVVTIAGNDDPAAVESDVRALLQQRDLDGALAAIGRARTPNAMLRTLAGDLRWMSHDLDGGAAEYRAALAMGPGDDLRVALDGRISGITEEIAVRENAHEVARRNSWLAVLAVIVVAAFAGALWWVSRRHLDVLEASAAGGAPPAR